MAQSGYTPILIYASGTSTNVPLAANLTSTASGAELALNYADGKLFYKDSGGTVQVLASKGAGTIGGSNTQIQFNNNGSLDGSSSLTWDGTYFKATLMNNTAIVPRVVALTDATSVTFNADTTDIATQANTQVAGTLTINAPTGTPYNGQKIIFRLLSTNAQTFSWNAAFQGSGDLSLPTVSSGSSKYDYMGFVYNSTATKWQMLAKVFGF